MAELLVGGNVVATAEVADTSSKRLAGLLKRDGLEGVLVLPRTNSVHTLGMRFAIDVAFCDRSSKVLDVVTMSANRIGRPRVRANYVIEAEAGAFAKWGLAKGTEVELRP